MGRPKIDEPKSNRVTIRFTNAEFQMLKDCADENNQTIAQLIRKAVRRETGCIS